MYDALKDHEMKHPKVANRFLDAGMLLFVCGALASSAVALGIK